MKDRLVFHEEVAAAIKADQPVVALESTIISHGMPYPKNLETAAAVEEVVRKNGAVPATIAILNGACHVGLNKEALETLASSKDVWKVSIRDIPYVISKKLMGATTVAATMRIASVAGVSVFATGGIGGVHRGAEKTMDISADLTEMKETSVTIVSAGVKSILDIGLTLEYLETMGVPVVTMKQDGFPSFYSRESGHPSPLRMDNEREVAELMRTKWSMGLSGAILVANPIPADQEIPSQEIEKHIRVALEAANQQGIAGKDLTPFLLSYIANHSGGESLEANIALIKHNAATAARIAVAYQNK